MNEVQREAKRLRKAWRRRNKNRVRTRYCATCGYSEQSHHSIPFSERTRRCAGFTLLVREDT